MLTKKSLKKRVRFKKKLCTYRKKNKNCKKNTRKKIKRSKKKGG